VFAAYGIGVVFLQIHSSKLLKSRNAKATFVARPQPLELEMMQNGGKLTKTHASHGQMGNSDA